SGIPAHKKACHIRRSCAREKGPVNRPGILLCTLKRGQRPDRKDEKIILFHLVKPLLVPVRTLPFYHVNEDLLITGDGFGHRVEMGVLVVPDLNHEKTTQQGMASAAFVYPFRNGGIAMLSGFL